MIRAFSSRLVPAAVEPTTVESTPYTDFLAALDLINIDPAAGNATEPMKTELRSLLNPKANFMSQILDNATLPLEPVTIDRLAKIAFAFSPDPENTYAKRATMILGNALQEAGPQSVFHISARLEQIDLNPARDALKQAMHRPTYVSADVLQRAATEDVTKMLSQVRQENFPKSQRQGILSKATMAKPPSASQAHANNIVEMLHQLRSGK